jgi:hypothetical protein
MAYAEATKFESPDPRRVVLQWPLCAYPRRAIYAGGSILALGNFTCRPGGRPPARE